MTMTRHTTTSPATSPRARSSEEWRPRTRWRRLGTALLMLAIGLCRGDNATADAPHTLAGLLPAGALAALEVDDLAALHEQAVHGLIDAIDVAPQIGKRGRCGGRWFRHGTIALRCALESGPIDRCGPGRKQRKH